MKRRLLFALCLALWATNADAVTYLRSEIDMSAVGSNFVLTVPNTIVDGDLMTVYCASLNGGIGAVTGWTTVASNGATDRLYKRVASSDASVTYNFPFTSGNYAVCYFEAWYDGSGNALSVTSGSVATTGASVNLTPPNQSVSAWDIVPAWAGPGNGDQGFGHTAIGASYLDWHFYAGDSRSAVEYDMSPSTNAAFTPSTFNSGGTSTTWRYGVAVISGASAPAHDYRVRTQQTCNSPSGGTCSISTSGVSNGDLMVLVISGDSGTPSTPTGWTLIGNDSAQFPAYIYVRIASSEPGTYSLGSGSTHIFAGLVAYHDNAGQPLVVKKLAFGNQASAASATAPAISPSSGGDQIEVIYLPSTDALDRLIPVQGWTLQVQTLGAGSHAAGTLSALIAPSTASLTPPSMSLHSGGSVTWEMATLDIGVGGQTGLVIARRDESP
jgi:hypothetical protein